MKDVLIRSTAGEISHKREGNVPPGEVCYWTVNGTPRQTEPGRRIWFAWGGWMFATARITALEDGRIWFEPLRDADLPAPRDPPTRGFVYVDPVEGVE